VILERIWPVEGSIRIAVLVDSVQTDPDPTANVWEPATAGFAGKTSAMWAVTSPVREICQRELPLRAHRDPNPATSAEGSGRATLSVVGEDDGDGDDGEGVELGVVGWVEVVTEVDAVVHAASSTAVQAK
jgi:hypothetical protein